MLAFSLFTLLATYLIQRLQHVLPFNPQALGSVEQGSAFNTAVSFTTNTNWQGYVQESFATSVWRGTASTVPVFGLHQSEWLPPSRLR